VRDLPGLFDVRLKARSIAYLYVTGATLALLTLVFPHADEVRDGALIILAAIAYVISAPVWLAADRMREWHIHALLAAGTVIVSLANYYAGPSTLYPLLYTWAVLYACYFFPLREAVAHMVFVAVAYAVTLAVQDADMVVVRWLLAIGTPVVAGLLISRLLGRLQAQARELGESDQRTRLVLDTAPDAFITLDRHGHILTWNAAAERLFGWTKQEAIGKTMRELVVPPEFRERHDERRNALVESDAEIAMERFEVEFVKRDGQRFPGEATVSKVEARGEVLISGFITDVTELLRQQAEREALLREQAARAEA
jgi:PAS domain S-box-containing protein